MIVVDVLIMCIHPYSTDHLADLRDEGPEWELPAFVGKQGLYYFLANNTEAAVGSRNTGFALIGPFVKKQHDARPD